MKRMKFWKGPVSLAAAMLLLASPGFGGMAELGQSAGDTAGGGGRIRVTMNPTATFDTNSGDTVSDILTQLADDINTKPQFADFDATYDSAIEIEILKNGSIELDDLDLESSDSNLKKGRVSKSGTFGFIYASSQPTGAGTVTVQVNLLPPIVLPVSASTTPLGILEQLKPLLAGQGLDVVFKPSQGFLEIDAGSTISWDSDLGAGITSFHIGVGNTRRSTAGMGSGIPTLSEWGILILVSLLLGSALWVLRRRAGARVS
jgi:IPTL-CTERM motif